MLKIVRLIFLIALMVMSFFAGVILNNPKLRNNYKDNEGLIVKKKEKVFIVTTNEEITEIDKDKKENIMEEYASKVNENEIEDNDESLEINNNTENIEKSENNNVDNNIKKIIKNNKNEDGYTKKNEIIPVAVSK